MNDELTFKFFIFPREHSELLNVSDLFTCFS